jgi:hypothetical protein
MDTAQWLDEFAAADLSPMERAMARARMADAKTDAAEAQVQAEREAKRLERDETLILADRQMGGARGELARQQALLTAADDRVRDAEDELRRAQQARDRYAGNVQFFAQRMAEATGLAQRSAPVDPAEAAVQRARQEHREFSRSTRAALSRAATGRRPFGGDARRSDPADCPHCLKLGCTPEESFAIHHMTADGELLSASPDRPVAVPDDSSERRSALGDFPVIVR